MKKATIPAAAVALLLAALLAGCGSAPQQTDGGSSLDHLSPYEYFDPLTGEQCTFIFSGNTWSQEVGGKRTISGTLQHGETETILTITRRHVSDPAQWVGVRDEKTILLQHEANPLSLRISR
jgi:uncharacterized secreted protein with C-terminal beta-propeller domain